MNELEQFVTEQNVWHYINLLASETNADERRVYAHLLRVEADRYAREAARLDAIERWINKCDGHIARHKSLMEKNAVLGIDQTMCRQVIEGMIDAKEVLIALRQIASGRVDSAAECLAKKAPHPGS